MKCCIIGCNLGMFGLCVLVAGCRWEPQVAANPPWHPTPSTYLWPDPQLQLRPLMSPIKGGSLSAQLAVPEQGAAAQALMSACRVTKVEPWQATQHGMLSGESMGETVRHSIPQMCKSSCKHSARLWCLQGSSTSMVLARIQHACYFGKDSAWREKNGFLGSLQHHLLEACGTCKDKDSMLLKPHHCQLIAATAVWLNCGTRKLGSSSSAARCSAGSLAQCGMQVDAHHTHRHTSEWMRSRPCRFRNRKRIQAQVLGHPHSCHCFQRCSRKGWV